MEDVGSPTGAGARDGTLILSTQHELVHVEPTLIVSTAHEPVHGGADCSSPPRKSRCMLKQPRSSPPRRSRCMVGPTTALRPVGAGARGHPLLSIQHAPAAFRSTPANLHPACAGAWWGTPALTTRHAPVACCISPILSMGRGHPHRGTPTGGPHRPWVEVSGGPPPGHPHTSWQVGSQVGGPSRVISCGVGVLAWPPRVNRQQGGPVAERPNRGPRQDGN